VEYGNWYFEEGEYLITDTISGENYKVCVLVRKDNEDHYYSYVSSYICYEEKLNYPPSSLEEKRMDEFYKLIFRNNGEKFKKSYSRG
jgi:protein associated with RNAse G/E